MKQIIQIDEDKCRSCSNCASVCPVQGANITHISVNKLNVCVDAKKCIACGACLKACPNGARFYNDDTERFFSDLRSGEPIALIVAPAFKENFENWRSILAWLKTQGIKIIIDVSFGIEICMWAHLRYMERYRSEVLITQPCPPIIGYIEKYHPELYRKISPVFSPILCASVCLKKTLALPERIAALTPCPAKTYEFVKANSVGYNVTFKKLAEYLSAYNIMIPQADFQFDNISAALGRASAMTSSLPESVLRMKGCISVNVANVKVAAVQSHDNIYHYLDLVAGETPEARIVLLDALNCKGGCCNGAGSSIGRPEFHHVTQLNYKGEMENDSGQAYLFLIFDDMLELSDYIKPA
jgi:iron only hydrogenase large subunit-like protein